MAVQRGARAPLGMGARRTRRRRSGEGEGEHGEGEDGRAGRPQRARGDHGATSLVVADTMSTRNSMVPE